jgi:Phage integrase family
VQSALIAETSPTTCEFRMPSSSWRGPRHPARKVTPASDALVFTSPEGHPLRRTKFRPRWAEACRKAKVSGLHFHDLRGSGATWAAVAGATLPELMHRLGHSTHGGPALPARHERAEPRGCRPLGRAVERRGAERRSGRNRASLIHEATLRQRGRSGDTLLQASASVSAVQMWCRRGDLNPHPLARTSPSSWRVCLFRHSDGRATEISAQRS